MRGTKQVLLVRWILAALKIQIFKAVKVLLTSGIMSKFGVQVLIQFFENRIATYTCTRQTPYGVKPKCDVISAKAKPTISAMLRMILLRSERGFLYVTRAFSVSSYSVDRRANPNIRGPADRCPVLG